MTYRKIYFILLVMLLPITACGRNSGDFDVYTEDTSSDSVVEVSRMLQSNALSSLTIFIPIRESFHFNRAAEKLRRIKAENGVEIDIDIITYLPEQRETHISQMLSKLAAGLGPDIFVLDNAYLYPFIENSFIKDIYIMIDKSYNWNREDFFTTALQALEIDRRLYMLPMQFGFDFIGINANVPSGFRDRFFALDIASVSDIANLYLDLIAEYPKWGEFALVHGMDVIRAYTPKVNAAVDFSSRTANFPNSSEIMLEKLRTAFGNNDRFNTPIMINPTDESMAELQERYVFFSPLDFTAIPEAFFDFQTSFFTDFIPIADDNGRIIMRYWGTEIVVNAEADETLVWAFIEQLLLVIGTEGLNFDANPHIARRYARGYLGLGLETALERVEMRPIFGTIFAEIDRAIDSIMEYSEWPLIYPINNHMMPSHVFDTVLFEFFNNEMTAENAIYQMEVNITRWLNREREEPEIYVLEKELGNHLPLRTLTVKNPNNSTGVLKQAATAMNESWQKQGKLYTFQLVINDYAWGNIDPDIEQRERFERIERLRVQLMAGQGPDIFFLDGHGDYIRPWVKSGFLADINKLIYTCTRITRDDFFTEVLSAFEIENGLYMLPVSFGFYYVGVNRFIPQYFSERFTSYSVISILQMMEFYLDLKKAYGGEFGHLTPGVTWSLGTYGGIIQTVIGDFIDFNNSISNLLDYRFISFLNKMPQIFDGRESISAEWFAFTPTTEFMRNRAQSDLFEMSDFRLTPANAFFSRNAPRFIHYIPLVDNQGKLLIDVAGSNVWDVLFINAGGEVELAWEFITYVLQAYNAAVDMARIEPIFGTRNPWANQSFASPILRNNFDSPIRATIAYLPAASPPGYMDFIAFDDNELRERETEATVNRIAELNELPMTLLQPMIPMRLFEESLENFMRGFITAETAAQQMHNAVSLWLIE